MTNPKEVRTGPGLPRPNVEPAAITRLIVEGYKSFRERQELDLAPLTILAGASGSGKSSAIQALLLLHQTEHVGGSPNPLSISGPSVVFESFKEMFSAISGKPGKRTMTLGLSTNKGTACSTFHLLREVAIEIVRTNWITESDELVITPSTSSSELHKYFPDLRLPKYTNPKKTKTFSASLKPNRSGAFLYPVIHVENVLIPSWFVPEPADIRGALLNLIHVPAVRGQFTSPAPNIVDAARLRGVCDRNAAAYAFNWIVNLRSSEKFEAMQDALRHLNLPAIIVPYEPGPGTVNFGQLLVSNKGPILRVPIWQAGSGTAQVLPLVVALIAAERNQTVVIEQPEIHLHPYSQQALATLFAQAINRGVRLIVETHSEILISALRAAVTNKEIDPRKIKLYWFSLEKGESQVTSGSINGKGSFGDWPIDFGSVHMNVLEKLLKPRPKKTTRRMK